MRTLYRYFKLIPEFRGGMRNQICAEVQNFYAHHGFRPTRVQMHRSRMVALQQEFEMEFKLKLPGDPPEIYGMNIYPVDSQLPPPLPGGLDYIVLLGEEPIHGIKNDGALPPVGRLMDVFSTEQGTFGVIEIDDRTAATLAGGARVVVKIR